MSLSMARLNTQTTNANNPLGPGRTNCFDCYKEIKLKINENTCINTLNDSVDSTGYDLHF